MKIQNSSDLSMEQSIADEDSAEEFVVEEIVAKRYNNKTKEYEYLLKWEGYPSEQNTWEPYSNLTSCRYLIQNYEKRLYRKQLKNASKSSIVLPKSTEQNTITDYFNDTECKSTGHSGKSAVKSLITLDGRVISSDSAEWKNHVKNDQFSSSNHVNESNQLMNQINGEISESYEHDRSAAGVVENEHLQLPTSNSVDLDVPSDTTLLNSDASIADSFDLSSTDVGADGVNKTDNSNINSDSQLHVNVSLTSSVRTGPLPPPKKRIFDPSMLTESSSASKIIPDISRIVTPKLVSETSVPSDQSSDLDIKQNITVADNKDDVCLEDSLQTELEMKSPSSKGSDQLTLKTELDYKHYVSGIHKKPYVLEGKIKCGDPMLEELSIKNRIKNESSQSILSSGIYSFQKDSAIAYLDSESDDNSLNNVLTELIQTRKRVLLVDSQCNSEIAFDLSTIFKIPEIVSLSGTILQKQTAVSLGIYPNSKSAPETGVNSSHYPKPTVQRTGTSSYEGHGTIRTKQVSSVPSESVYKVMSPKTVQKSAPILPPAATVRSNLSSSTASKLEGGGFRTQSSSYSEKNRVGSGGSFKRVTGGDRVTKSLVPSSLEKKIPNKTGTPNSSLRKLLGTFNPGRRSTDPQATGLNDTSKTENEMRPTKEFPHLEPDFPAKINKDPWSPVKKVKLDPTSGKRLEDEHASRSPAVSSPEHSPCSSPPRVPTDTNLSGVVIKAENQDVQDNHVQINSEIGYQSMDGSTPVMLQVQVGNSGVKEEPVPVDMASLPYSDGSVMNGNLVTITGEDGCLYQVENAKLEGDTILVSQDEEPQCIYELPDGSKVVRRLRIDGLPIFTLDDQYNNSLIQLAINDVSILPDGSEIIIKQDETGHTLQINPPNTQIPSDLVDSGDIPMSEPLQENGLPVTDNVNGVQQVVATLLEAGEAPAEDGSRKVVLLMPDGNLMMTEVDEEQFAALELQK